MTVAKHRPPISDTELLVLKTLWDLSEGTVRDIMDALSPRRQWAYTTAQTILNRLEAKGYVKSRKGKLAHVYRPAVSREQLLQQSLNDLSRRLCEGTTSPLLMALVEGVRLSPQEIHDLRRLLDEMSRTDDVADDFDPPGGQR